MAASSTAAEFRGLDPDLPSIAALAAAEVDGLIRHQPSGVDNLGRVAQLLTTLFERPPQGGGAKRLLDPISASVFASTWRDARATINSYDELASASLDLAEQMQRAQESGSDIPLTMLKRFCLALSRYALASAEGLDTVTNMPEYKR